MKWQEIETRNAFWVINWVNNDSARRAAVPGRIFRASRACYSPVITMPV